MHEMALMSKAMDIVLEQADRVGAKRVTRVCMTIGDGRDVIEDLLTGVFGYLARNTVAEGADLDVVRTPFLARCDDCGRVYHINMHDRSTFSCPACAAEHRFTVLSGWEFRVERIEVSSEPLDDLVDEKPCMCEAIS
jgi:hydrogenase nickel incorporation protein HypA/HybF